MCQYARWREDLRSQSAEALERLSVEGVATLLSEGAAKLHRVSQDGMRVWASAGSASFRKGSFLDRCSAEAQAQVRALRSEFKRDIRFQSRWERAARERSARARLEEVRRARARLEEIRREKASRERKRDQGKLPRASTTDCAMQVIVGVRVTSQGTDSGWLGRAVREVEPRYGVRPKSALADGGFQCLGDIEVLEKQGTQGLAQNLLRGSALRAAMAAGP